MPTFTYGNRSIDYRLEYKHHKRDCTISVDWRTGVTVIVPENVDPARIEAVIQRKAPWILRKLSELGEIKPLSTRLQFISGEKLPYLGRQYRLRVVAAEDIAGVSFTFQNGRFLAGVPKSSSADWREERLRQAFREWCIRHGAAKVRQRVQLFAPRLGLHPAKVVVKEQKSRWGSCTKNGTININWRILMAPMRIVDYVVVHELAHMIHRNHSPDFWSVVASVLPDYAERKEWLRVHGPALEV
ncbi:M48 family metallopeptidase [Kyrpidia tusciae]|uniref:YgjP-like metallopeptidase domain-containing protein n=1 Tax=Kyrpidia tusciae (strain DSM 2912 / NBRC 15312 / T2) TaxID=562970 RepID=D5WQ36_KYRT2|nr:SprT family zinc-dependent metalloprotease [Kyrpidia tusciae]ADG06445.1 protein of unknown function DUF45 [Kyrpidia tusciae DSM 2912]